MGSKGVLKRQAGKFGNTMPPRKNKQKYHDVSKRGREDF